MTALPSLSASPDAGHRRPAPTSHLIRLFLIGTSLAVLLIILRIPNLSRIPCWMWKYMPSRGVNVLAALALVALPAVLLARYAGRALQRGKSGRGLLVLVALGVFASNASPVVTFLSRWPITHLVGTTGHAEIAAAVTHVPAARILRDYEGLLRTGELGRFAPTRGPGAVFVYRVLFVASEVPVLHALLRPLASVLDLRETYLGPFPEYGFLIWVVFSITPWLTILPLYWMCRGLFPKETAAWVPVLLLAVPSPLMVVFHQDGAIFMPIFAVIFALALRAQTDRRPLWAALAGLLGGLGTFFSLGLTATLAWLIAAPVLRLPSESAGGAPRSVRDRFRDLALTLLGFAAALLVLRLGLRFDLPTRIREALVYHEGWRSQFGFGRHAAHIWVWASLLEFLIYLGPAVVIALAAGLIREAKEPRRILVFPFSTIFLLAALFLLAYKHHQPETIRLWLFLVPPAVICAVAALSDLARGKPEDLSRVMTWVLGCQYVFLVILIAFRPFY